ncbi:MAG TPA: isochorismatase family cysteine hydrolase [Rhodanobacteraceae bacterium]|nr:isochorismatase family cysteine hydrolase [Rhodanobacteraceae bacterium]
MVQAAIPEEASKPLANSALLIIDMINQFDFPGGDALRRQCDDVATAIETLRQRFDEAHRPVIYVNDNFGRWRSNFEKLIERCERAGSDGGALARRMAPRPTDYFVLKPQNSAFYHTPLVLLLASLKARELTLAGIAGDQCVMQTAMDAHLRDYGLQVPADATASITPARNRRALDYLHEVVGVDTTPVASGG